ncbi:hypothetical protein [Methanolapillus millepedarum]|uniref:Uncharacterized protein n=1 Tax=Methanolapillus millepedarum TaxID=3028296 RepID=A0AA96V1N5_9EURY|nr:hypothetical protein MsAc7_03170 [Methanosarcinaceae archaeon Ac7]
MKQKSISGAVRNELIQKMKDLSQRESQNHQAAVRSYAESTDKKIQEEMAEEASYWEWEFAKTCMIIKELRKNSDYISKKESIVNNDSVGGFAVFAKGAE